MAKKLRCELISWSEVQRQCQRLAGLVRESGFNPDLIVAIGRGGYVPARLLCDYLDIMDLTSIKVEHYLPGADQQEQTVIRYPPKADIRGLRVLLVDDVNDSGDTLVAATEHLWTFQPADVRTAVMHEKTVTSITADYSARKVIKWRWLIYPWAVNEDVKGFLEQLPTKPESLIDVQKLLEEQYSIKVPLQRLENIYASMTQ
jgi:hypoxanthine phosphoribosyltransferase